MLPGPPVNSMAGCPKQLGRLLRFLCLCCPQRSTELTIYIKATCKQQLLCSSTCKQIYGDMICVDYDLVYDFSACRQASNVVQLSVESSIWFIYTFFSEAQVKIEVVAVSRVPRCAVF